MNFSKLSLTEDGVGYKHNGGYKIVESTDRVLYQEIPGVKGQYTNKLVLDTSIISLHDCIIQQLIHNGYSSEDIEKALSLGTAEKRESYVSEQLKNYKPSIFTKFFQGEEQVIQNKKVKFSAEIQKYEKISNAYEELLFDHHAPIEEEEFYSLSNAVIDDVTTLGYNSDEGYDSDV